jgi:thiosulfate/3-mercaptopyruvate sulfurtransferase
MTEITLDELVSSLDNIVLIDVRTPEEYSGELGYPCDPRQGHIPGALNVPLQELDPQQLDVPAGAGVVAYCHSGSRSAIAAQMLRAAGYDARNYPGSWHEWSRTDLPAESG